MLASRCLGEPGMRRINASAPSKDRHIPNTPNGGYQVDAQTRRLRARNKAVANKRGKLPQYPARGLGRKLKPAESFPLVQCNFIEGGHRTLIYKRRKEDNSLYAIPLIKGGTRCTETSLASHRCLNHLGREQ